MTGETANGRSIKRSQEILAAKLKARDRPGRREAEDQVERHRDRRGDEQGQANRAARLRVGDRGEIDAHPLAQGLSEDGDQRQHEEETPGKPARQRDDRASPRRVLVARGGDADFAQRSLRSRPRAPSGLYSASSDAMAESQLRRCSRLISKSIENEITSITRAIAVAP